MKKYEKKIENQRETSGEKHNLVEEKNTYNKKEEEETELQEIINIEEERV